MGSKAIKSIMIAAAACVSAVTAKAQLAPGMNAPETQLVAIRQLVGMGCFLAVAGRPFPGINQPLTGMAGEGLKPQDNPPAWFAPYLNKQGRNQLSTLDTPQGKVWIAFNHTSRDCRIGTQTSKPEEMRDGLIGVLADQKSGWLVTGMGADRVILGKKIDGSSVEWTAEIVVPAQSPGLLLVAMSAK